MRDVVSLVRAEDPREFVLDYFNRDSENFTAARNSQ